MFEISWFLSSVVVSNRRLFIVSTFIAESVSVSYLSTLKIVCIFTILTMEDHKRHCSGVNHIIDTCNSLGFNN
jgi:hypothetical protein